MIEDKSIGLKIAEDKDEAFWMEVKKKCENAIDMSEKDIIINKHILKLCEEKLVKK